jgi:hypothetical protein
MRARNYHARTTNRSGIMSYYDSFYPDVKVMPRFNFDGEIDSIDVFIDNMHDNLHCEEFVRNDVPEKVGDKRFEAQRRVALKELTPGMYTESGNTIRHKKRKDAK